MDCDVCGGEMWRWPTLPTVWEEEIWSCSWCYASTHVGGEWFGVVERTFGWLMNHRRLARDYETHPHRSEAMIRIAMIRIAMIDLMSRWLTRESTPNWKDS